ncbi:hypothetical protein AB1Y20_004504 [Prymnesium parvum]|uniref:RRM domain-containing protein n=1 Tax=Prymnesium parvum TaxID=97485 RepID=A0AB34IXQ6_PRYPA
MPAGSDSDSYSYYSDDYSRSPSPAPRRQKDRKPRRQGGRRASPPPRRNERERPQPPKSAVLHVRNLTRNVTADHLREIFGNFGSVKSVELAMDKVANVSKGFAYVEFASRDHAQEAIGSMDGGDVDGLKVHVGFVGQNNANKDPPPRRDRSPPRRSPPRRRSPSPRRASPPRGRPRDGRSRSRSGSSSSESYSD